MDLHKLRHTILDDNRFAIDPITTMQARRALDAWYMGLASEEMTKDKLVKLKVLSEV